VIDSQSDQARSLLQRVAGEVLALDPGSIARVAIDGVDGAGKTTFADELCQELASSRRQVIRICADDFLNSAQVRHRRGRDSPEGFFLDSYDYAALRRLVLDPLGPGGTRRFRRRAFDLRADRPVDAVEEEATPDAILLLEGLFLHRDELWRTWNYSLFLDVDFDVSLARCARRDTKWASPDPTAATNRRYVGGQEIYLSRCDPRTRATHVIDNNDLSAPRRTR
jgi:uridine kinase